MEENQKQRIDRCLEDLSGLVQKNSGLMLRLERELYRESGFTSTQAVLLAMLLPHPEGLRMGAIAQNMALDPSTVTRVSAVLEKQGLIAREREAADSRQVLARLTEGGKSAAVGLAAQRKDFLVGLLSRLPAGHVREVMNACETFNSAIQGLLED